MDCIRTSCSSYSLQNLYFYNLLFVLYESHAIQRTILLLQDRKFSKPIKKFRNAILIFWQNSKTMFVSILTMLFFRSYFCSSHCLFSFDNNFRKTGKYHRIRWTDFLQTNAYKHYFPVICLLEIEKYRIKKSNLCLFPPIISF